MGGPPVLPSGRRHEIALVVPQNWTPEQAHAVFVLLEDLREVICSRYPDESGESGVT